MLQTLIEKLIYHRRLVVLESVLVIDYNFCTRTHSSVLGTNLYLHYNSDIDILIFFKGVFQTCKETRYFKAEYHYL